MEKEEIRRLMLKALEELNTELPGELFHDNFILRKMKELSDDIRNKEIPINKLIESAQYLSDGKLIEYEPSGGMGPTVMFFARINKDGQDVIDNPNRLDAIVPLSQSVQQTINVSGGQANIIGIGDINQIINEAPPEIKKELDEFMEEIKNSLDKKSKLKEWLKSLGASAIPILYELFKKYIGLLL